MKNTRYTSLPHYEMHHVSTPRKVIAERLGVSSCRYTALRDPDRYTPRLTEKERDALAALLNRDAVYVERLYTRSRKLVARVGAKLHCTMCGAPRERPHDCPAVSEVAS